MDQKRSWTSRLKGLMLKHFGVNIPDHVRQLVMQLGQVPQGNKMKDLGRPLQYTSTDQVAIFSRIGPTVEPSHFRSPKE